MRVRHLWYHRQDRRGWRNAFAAAAPCDPVRTIARLSAVPQPELGWFARAVAWFTTPFKFLGVSGWVDTGCSGSGSGRLVRDAQHSTDGFWTIDVALEDFAIAAYGAPAGRFLRLECEPETGAHRVCTEKRLAADDRIRFAGPIVVDTDGPFLEMHPGGELEVIDLPPESGLRGAARGR